MTDAELRHHIELFLSERLETEVSVLDLERSTEGFSQETFVVEAEVHRAGVQSHDAWVIKREPEAGLLEPYDLEPEFRVLHALSDDPLPSPATPWFERDPAVLERPFYVMEKLAGDAVVPAAGPDGAGPLDAAERLALAPQVTGTLADLHAVDWRALGLDFLGVPAPGTEVARRELERWEARIHRAEMPLAPMLADALHWLHAHVPETDEITLVHGDYRLGNFLIERTGADTKLRGVLDWEMVHLGDPLEDVAWCASELWRGGTDRAGALVDLDEFIGLYAKASDRSVPRDRFQFYSVLAVVKMIAIMLTGLRAYRDGRTRDLRMALFDHQLPFLHALLALERGWLPRPS